MKVPNDNLLRKNNNIETGLSNTIYKHTHRYELGFLESICATSNRASQRMAIEKIQANSAVAVSNFDKWLVMATAGSTGL